MAVVDIQQIPCSLWNPDIHCCSHNNLPLYHTDILIPVLKLSLSLRFSDKNLYASHLPVLPHAPPSHSPSFDHNHDMWPGVQSTLQSALPLSSKHPQSMCILVNNIRLMCLRILPF